MPQTRGSGSGSGSLARRFGAVAASVALATVAAPAAAHAQDTGTGSLGSAGTTDSAGTESADELVGLLPEEIVIGGPDIGGGSEGLRDTGSGQIPDAAISVGQSVGSVAPLEAVGSAGGSAAASVASSGSVAGSVYTNPTGSIGSGTIGLGSVAIPEYIFPVLSVNLLGGYFAAMGERQDAGELYPHELTFWHGVVEGSAEGGTAVEDAAAATGTALPGSLAGSIDNVQIAALEDPFEEQEKLRAELEAEAAAEGDDVDAGQTSDYDDDEAVTGEDDATAVTADRAVDDEEAATAPTLDAAVAPAPPAEAPVAAAPAVAAGPATASAGTELATTGAATTAVAGVAVVTLLLGGLLVASSRRRA